MKIRAKVGPKVCIEYMPPLLFETLAWRKANSGRQRLNLWSDLRSLKGDGNLVLLHCLWAPECWVLAAFGNSLLFMDCDPANEWKLACLRLVGGFAVEIRKQVEKRERDGSRHGSWSRGCIPADGGHVTAQESCFFSFSFAFLNIWIIKVKSQRAKTFRQMLHFRRGGINGKRESPNSVTEPTHYMYSSLCPISTLYLLYDDTRPIAFWNQSSPNHLSWRILARYSSTLVRSVTLSEPPVLGGFKRQSFDHNKVYESVKLNSMTQWFINNHFTGN